VATGVRSDLEDWADPLIFAWRCMSIVAAVDLDQIA